MTWVIEDLAGAKNSSNHDFTISHTPIMESMMVVYQGIKLVRVAVSPTPGEAQYSSASNNVAVGQAPASGEDLWTRYWYD